MTDEITKPKDTLTEAPKKVKFGAVPAFHAKIMNQAKVEKERAETSATEVNSLPNRIGLMLDISGSMSGEKMDMLKIAAQAFIDSCDSSNTAVAVNTFEPLVRVHLTNYFPVISKEIPSLHEMGGTPMADAMQEMLHNEPITRGVLVSDGQPNDESSCYELAEHYREATIPIDTVHIGYDNHGVDCLKRIADITGGIFIKFKDASQFAKSFKFLTPSFRAMLVSSTEDERQKLLGSDKVR